MTKDHPIAWSTAWAGQTHASRAAVCTGINLPMFTGRRRSEEGST